MSSPGDALAQIQEKDKRIRALEAELALQHGCREKDAQAVKDSIAREDALKAELEKATATGQNKTGAHHAHCKFCKEREARVAEDDRILADIGKHIHLCHDSSDSNLDSFYARLAKKEAPR